MFYAPTPEGVYYPRHYSHSLKHTHEDILATYPSSSSSSASPRAHHQTYSSMRRSRTVGGAPYSPDYDYDFDYDPSDADPCVRLPHTYAWVLEQQIADMVKQNDETVRWVHEQQARDTLHEQVALRLLAGRRSSHTHTALDARYSARGAAAWAESAERERQRERERRWKRWEREAEFTVQDELRRLQAHRREAERHRAAYERRKRAEEEKERIRREWERETVRARREEREREAGRRYQARWGELLSSEGTLGFRDIPWPTFSQPKALEGLSPAKVAMFVLSPLHPGETRREKIRNALRRWHPDRFARLAGRIEEAEKEAIEEGVGIVARCLNDLLERESQEM